MPRRRGRDQRLDFDQHRPRAFDAGEHRRAGRRAVAPGEEQRARIGDFGEPAAGHLEHADLVGRAEAVLRGAQHAEGVRAFALERQHRVDHVLDHPRAGDLAVLGDVADQDQRRAARLGEADQRLRRAAHLAHRARRRFDRVAPHGLDGIDDDELRRVARAERGDDVLDQRLRRQLHRRAGEAEPRRPQPHLFGRFLARDIDDATAAPRQRGAGLDQQRRLADARFAADQCGRAGDEAAAGDPVEFADAGDDARLRRGGAGKVLEREGAPGRAAPRRSAADAERRRLFDDRVPLAAGVALALPALGDRAAVLADIGRAQPGHAGLVAESGPLVERPAVAHAQWPRTAPLGARSASQTVMALVTPSTPRHPPHVRFGRAALVGALDLAGQRHPAMVAMHATRSRGTARSQ